MVRPSSIERQDEAIREEIARLRGAGHSLDEILSALRELDVHDVSRSALGRHIKKMDEVTKKMRHARNIAEAMVRKMGDAGASQFARANVELLHSVILDLHLADEGMANKDGVAALKGNPRGIEALAKALDHLTKASKTDADFVAQIEEQTEERLRRRDKKNLKNVAKEKGLSREVIEIMRTRVLGIKS
ncbi:DUF3486 family protein [Komagataeibacter medellinensis]|uniref:DUF3486 family protein n=1 Tax=Komagataeibacter medellinensis TaxID=1177712 RepID=A0ABQ6VXY9_9PROT|nr:phage protein Gp27 family protein [Komagataeibacter medellinensis]KAB8123988.1 DUF3486 family protein [Komagataeibacter medellinensis]